jgi:hypothetical protein
LLFLVLGGSGALEVFDDGAGGLGVLFVGEDGEAGEKELGDVGEGDGVLAGHALASELLEDVAEEEIEGAGGVEAFDVAEELLGEMVVVAALAFHLHAGVMGAKNGTGGSEHVTAASGGADVPAGGGGREVDGDGGVGGGPPTPYGFFRRV